VPKVNWGVGADDVDDWDRDSQYKPYDGPIPPNGVYEWLIKKLQYVAAAGGKLPQLRIGLELVPREGRREKKYGGYFIMGFLPIAANTAFKYVPFLDAVGVSGRDFTQRTITDEDGNIQRIGKWRNTGEELISAELKDGRDQDGQPRKELGWMGPLPELDEDDDEEYPDDEYDEEIEDPDATDGEEPF
jgi:hypothetical protein